MDNFLKRLDLKIGVIEFYEFFAIGYINPNTNFDQNERQIFLDACLDYFAQKPFGYISFRKHSYSINPMIYTNLNNVETLKAFAIITSSNITKGNAKIEGQFFKKPFGIFENKSEATLWMKEIIEKF